jgi:imidazolonepropionase-like amidohydrolase
MIRLGGRPALAGWPFLRVGLICLSALLGFSFRSVKAHVWLANCKILDVVTGEVSSETNLSVTGIRIGAISPTVKAQDELVIDLQGRYVMPGLFSCHAHLSMEYPFSAMSLDEPSALTAFRAAKKAKEALHAGVTTLRCVGEKHRVDVQLKKAGQMGLITSPRVLAAGHVLTVTGGHGGATIATVVDGAEGFLAAGRRELALGADHLKICISGGLAEPGELLDEPQMSAEEIKAVVFAARQNGTYVTAHAGGSLAVREAVSLGVRCFEHGYRLDDETVAAMAQNKAALCPTLCVTSLPDFMRREGFTEWQIGRSQEAHLDHVASFKRAVNVGVALISGTDYLPAAQDDGAAMAIREMELMAEFGATPLQVIQSATVNPAQLCGLGTTTGRVETGFEADLLVLDESPMESVGNLRSIAMVIRAGEVVADKNV